MHNTDRHLQGCDGLQADADDECWFWIRLVDRQSDNFYIRICLELCCKAFSRLHLLAVHAVLLRLLSKSRTPLLQQIRTMLCNFLSQLFLGFGLLLSDCLLLLCMLLRTV